MMEWIKRALTRKVLVRGKLGEPKIIEIEPNKRLVIGVKLVMITAICLTTLEIAHMALLGSWNSEIFAAITALIGTILGVFFGKRG